MIIEYMRVRESAHPPERANPSDAGLDLYFNPEPQGFLPTGQRPRHPRACQSHQTGRWRPCLLFSR